MKPLGTILPNAKTLTLNDAFCQERKAQEVKKADQTYAKLSKQVISGEVRYYKSPTIYVLPNGLWFKQRQDGYWYASGKNEPK